MKTATFFQTYQRQSVDNKLAILKGDQPTDAKFEPHQGTPVSVIGTIRTGEEWANYLARTGSLGPLAYLAALSATANDPRLAAYIPDYSVAKESQPLAEQGRDQSGFVQQTAPQINATNKHGPSEKKPYSANPYSYTKYSATNLKSAFKKVYTGIEDEVKKLFSKIRSVYQSSRGIIRSRKLYWGRGITPVTENVVLLENYRKRNQQRQYNPPQSDNQDLEQRLAA
mgnify:CR=1 FL=1